MAQVSLQINGFGYVLGCADGEEEHLLMLAASLDRRIDEIKTATGPVAEARALVMAALMLADELHDLRQQGPGGAKPADKAEPKAGKRLRGLAKKAEAIADLADAAAPPQSTLLSPEQETPAADVENIAAPTEHS